MLRREVIIADRWFPSSKTCSNCGFKDEKLILKDREFRCPCCKLKIDRDLNASFNLASIYLKKQYPGEDSFEILNRDTVGFTGINASGDGSSSSSMVNSDSPSLNEESSRALKAHQS